MKTTLITAVAALGLLSATAAHAGEGNGEPFAFRAPGVTATAAPSLAADTGSAAYPNLAGRPSWAVATTDGGDALAATGSEGTVQTANSLPRGAMNGTVAAAQAGSAQPLAQQAASPGAIVRTAQVRSGKPGG